MKAASPASHMWGSPTLGVPSTGEVAGSLHAAAHLVGLDGPRLHVQVPDLDGEIVPGEHVAAAVAELHVGHRGDDF